MKTERFNQLRKRELELHFTNDRLVKLWRRKVKHQLRGADIRDIFDHYDFNYSIEKRVETIRSDILDGGYRAEKPLIIKVEKKMGICRHLIIPHPTDALVLQAITDIIFHSLEEWQPSKNAFYSRDVTSVKLPHEVPDDYFKNWFSQWKEMQKVIFGFSQSKKFIVSTDITNYFDSIDLSTLREKILSIAQVSAKDKSGVLVDLLFSIIEEISWRPDYLPYKKHGLPTINLESIRLLGHIFLFEVDNILKLKTKESFTRWMDDVTIGVEDRKEAAEILGGISDTLKSSGLALNLAKTQLYSPTEFAYNFLIELNRFLDELKDKETLTKSELKKFRSLFTNHLRDKKPQHWTKVTKRFFSMHSKYNIRISDKRIRDLYSQHPQIRLVICKYLYAFGYSAQSRKLVLEILKELDVKDDIALFYIVDLITRWNVSDDGLSEIFIKEVLSYISLKEPFHFFCALWVRAKYDHPDSLLWFISKFENKWKKEPLLRRQVTAVMARAYQADTKKIELFLKEQIRSNDISTVSVANHILDFSNNDGIEFGVKGYVFPKNLNMYSLERFLVLCSVLNSKKIRQDKNLKKKVKELIKDSYYKKWLSVSYNIS